MAKWSVILVLMMVVIVAVTVEADQENGWILCFRDCGSSCRDDDGNCLEQCKIKCGGPNPPHGPPNSHSSPRNSRGIASVEVNQENAWTLCFRDCASSCGDADGNCLEQCKIKCGGPNPPHGPPNSHSSPRNSRGIASVEVNQENAWTLCFRDCASSCGDADGNCLEQCKIKCGGPNPPHGPPNSHSSPRNSRGIASVEVNQENAWTLCFRDCASSCGDADGNCLEQCKIKCGGPNPPHGPPNSHSSPRNSRGIASVEVNQENAWTLCFRDCASSCGDADGNCLEQCKIKCGGPNPPHGPPNSHSSPRNSRGIASVEVNQENAWTLCFRDCASSCGDADGNCLEQCKIKCGGPNPPHGPPNSHSSPRNSRGIASVEVNQDGWTLCFRDCGSSCRDDDGNCLEQCKIKCGGPNPPHGPPNSHSFPRY